MGLGHLKTRAIPAGASACPGPEGEARVLQARTEDRAGAVDGRRVPQRRFGLGLDLWEAELGCRVRPFGGVTGLARQAPVVDALAAAAAARRDVLHLQRHAPFPTVGAAVLPFRKHIGADFVARKRPLL